MNYLVVSLKEEFNPVKIELEAEGDEKNPRPAEKTDEEVITEYMEVNYRVKKGDIKIYHLDLIPEIKIKNKFLWKI